MAAGVDSNPPAVPRLNIIGAGTVGRSFARAWRCAGVFSIAGVVTRSLPTAREAVAEIAAGAALASFGELPEAEYLMLATPDQELPRVIAQLSELPAALPRHCIFHMSGAEPRAVFASLERVSKCSYARLHPVMTFPKGVELPRLSGTFCMLDADEAQRSFFKRALEAIGVSSFSLETADAALYHAANVFASNFLQTLLHLSFELYQSFGVSEEQARRITAQLVRSSVDNALARGPAAALTGPMRRGDVRTVERHLRSLDEWQSLHRFPGERSRLYAALSLETLQIVESLGELQAEQFERLKHLLIARMQSE